MDAAGEGTFTCFSTFWRDFCSLILQLWLEKDVGAKVLVKVCCVFSPKKVRRGSETVVELKIEARES